MLAVALALTASMAGSSAPRAVEVTRAKVPGTAVEIAIELPGFEAETPDDPKRTLLFGSLGDGVVVSVLYEENFPYLPGSTCVARHAKLPQYKAFKAGSTDCCEFTATLGSPAKKNVKLDQKHYHAFPSTPDFLFDIHLSVMELGRGKYAKTFEREKFQALAQSFQATGRVDAKTGALPEEVYAFRDEAAQVAGDGLAWCEQRCAERVDDWPAAFYLGALAYEREDAERILAGYGRAADLLAAMAERTPKHVLALATACDRAAHACFMRKKFGEAVPWLERLLEQTESADSEAVRRLLPSAHFNLAAGYAKSNQPDKAMESLRAAIAAEPDMRRAAAESELLAPLRSRKDFKELVGS